MKEAAEQCQAQHLGLCVQSLAPRAAGTSGSVRASPAWDLWHSLACAVAVQAALDQSQAGSSRVCVSSNVLLRSCMYVTHWHCVDLFFVLISLLRFFYWLPEIL